MRALLPMSLAFAINMSPVGAMAEDHKLLAKMSPADQLMYLRIKEQIDGNKAKSTFFGKLCPICNATSTGENIGYEKSLKEIEDKYK